MNLVDDDTSNKEPESIGSPAARQGVSSPGESNLSGFFSPESTAMDAIDNGPESGSFQVKTGDPLHQGKPTGVYASDRATVPAGDKMAGMNRILQGNLVQWHGVGPRFYLTLGCAHSNETRVI